MADVLIKKPGVAVTSKEMYLRLDKQICNLTDILLPIGIPRPLPLPFSLPSVEVNITQIISAGNINKKISALPHVNACREHLISVNTSTHAHAGTPVTKYEIRYRMCGCYRMIRRNHLTTNATRRTLRGTTSSAKANKKTCTCSSNRTQNENRVFFTFSGYLRHFWVWPRVGGRSCGYLAGTRLKSQLGDPFDSDF